MLDLLAALNSLSPLGVMALLGITIYTLVQQRRSTPNGEHLRALQSISRKLDHHSEVLHRQEVLLAEIKAVLSRRERA